MAHTAPPEGIVEQEGPPGHPAYTGHQRSEDPQARDEPGEEHGLASVADEKALRLPQALRSDPNVAAPPQDKGPSPFSAGPIADLVSYYGSEYAEHYGVPEV